MRSVKRIRKAQKTWRERLGRRRKAVAEATDKLRELAEELDQAQKVARGKTPLRLKALTIGRELTHVRESGGNNRGHKVEEIIRYAQGTVPEPWCVDLVIWCYGKAGSQVIKPGFTRAVRFMAGSPGVVRTSDPKRGQIVTYTFDHTGLFITWCDAQGNPRPKATATHIKALEGNTNSLGALQSDSVGGGDGVFIKVRHRSLVDDFLKVTG